MICDCGHEESSHRWVCSGGGYPCAECTKENRNCTTITFNKYVYTEQYDGYDRMGKDCQGGTLFMGVVNTNLDFKLARMVQEKLGMPDEQLHSLTTSIVRLNGRSITGNDYNAKKVIKYKAHLRLWLEDVQLMDDTFLAPEEFKKEERIHRMMLNGSTSRETAINQIKKYDEKVANCKHDTRPLFKVDDNTFYCPNCNREIPKEQTMTITVGKPND